jgi:8-oxo-dGTP pyrophosphatase MutT (NUDIX family)
VWDIIGGHCERGETPADTLVREFQEEANIKPRSFQEIAVLDEPHTTEHREAQYHVMKPCACRLPTQTTPRCSMTLSTDLGALEEPGDAERCA